MLKKTDLIERYAEKMETTKKDATLAVETMIDIVKECIKEDGLDLYGFVKFEKQYKEATTARSPKTGEVVKVPAKYAPKAKFSNAFKREMNE